MMGAERRSMAMNEEQKRLTAYHEGGHAIVAMNVPAADPVHKATIIPRGRALGMVMQLPEGDRYSMKFKQMTSRLAIMMAAPQLVDDAPEAARRFVYVTPVEGHCLLWESWLRHEVVAGETDEARISVSFNYAVRRTL